MGVAPGPGLALEVGARDREGAARILALESSRGADGVGDRQAEPPTGAKDASAFGHRGREIVHVLERHEGDRKVGN